VNASTAHPAKTTARGERPPTFPQSARILAWLQLLQSMASLLIGLAFVLQAGSILGGVPTPLPFLVIREPLNALARGVEQLLLAYPIFWVGLALFRLKPWAWISSMMLQGIVLFVNLASYFRGEANYLSMAISVLIVLYLNNAEVRGAFQPRPRQDSYSQAGERQPPGA
jgi:hypothetical protein